MNRCIDCHFLAVKKKGGIELPVLKEDRDRGKQNKLG